MMISFDAVVKYMLFIWWLWLVADIFVDLLLRRDWDEFGKSLRSQFRLALAFFLIWFNFHKG